MYTHIKRNRLYNYPLCLISTRQIFFSFKKKIKKKMTDELLAHMLRLKTKQNKSNNRPTATRRP